MSGKYYSQPRRQEDRELMAYLGTKTFFSLKKFRWNLRRRKRKDLDQPVILTETQENRLRFLQHRMNERGELHPGQD